ncbi:MAG: hypothetical protein D6785_04995 [Planctomycetota bacterium]|nr:MAG: hypothetical protein D6785_04995 [Planctomycetota bacterium]
MGNGMPEISKAKIVIQEGPKVVVHHGWTEMGQGVNTMALQFFCEETGIPPEIVEIHVETKEEALGGMTTASRGTSLVGNAIIEACRELKKDLENNSLDDLVGKVYRGEWICDWTTKPGAKVDKVITHYSYSYATQLAVFNEKGELEKIYAAHDVGKVINPLLFEGQVEGSIHMGLGYTFSEEFPMENGYPCSTRLRDLQILRAKDMPEVEVIAVEVKDPYGPYGAKGVGEIGLVPTAPAVCNGLYQVDGKRRYSLPIARKGKNTKYKIILGI